MIMENVDELYNKRMKICKTCPLYLENITGARCNPRLYLSETDKTTVSDRPKIGYKRGCNCELQKKLRLPAAKCVVNKW